MDDSYTATLAVPVDGEELLKRPESVEVRVLNGMAAGSVFVLRGKKRFTIGRGVGSDVLLPDPSVSSCHAELFLDDDGSVTLHDVGSSNGTRVGGIGLGGAPSTEQRRSRLASVPSG